MMGESVSDFCTVEVMFAVSICVLTAVWFFLHISRRKPIPSDQAEAVTITPETVEWEISKKLQVSEIGSNFNDWKNPVSTWGQDEEKKNLLFQSLELDQTEWERATEAVNTILSMLLYEIKKEARRYEGLIVEKYVKQGSAREGLKVCKADEFDVLLEFRFEDLDLKMQPFRDENNFILPEFGHLTVSDNILQQDLQKRYDWLLESCVIFDHEIGKHYLNSRKLHEKIFTSVIQKVAGKVMRKVNNTDTMSNFSFTIARFRKNPPAVNIQINLIQNDRNFEYYRFLTETKRLNYPVELEEAEEPDVVTPLCTFIDVDIVPGIQLTSEQVQDPTDENKTIECPRYAVFKLADKNQSPADPYNCLPEMHWRLCTSGYEKHIFDVSHGSKEQCYITTALRVMKRKFQILEDDLPPPQLVTVVQSYHLKHIAFYCILYLTVMNDVRLSGVRQALAYFLNFLKVALQEQRLPHFFYDNHFLVYMFPNYDVGDKTLRYDLFTGKPKFSLIQAEKSLKKLELKEEFCIDVFIQHDIPETFRSFIQKGKYFQATS